MNAVVVAECDSTTRFIPNNLFKMRNTLGPLTFVSGRYFQRERYTLISKKNTYLEDDCEGGQFVFTMNCLRKLLKLEPKPDDTTVFTVDFHLQCLRTSKWAFGWSICDCCGENIRRDMVILHNDASNDSKSIRMLHNDCMETSHTFLFFGFVICIEGRLIFLINCPS